MNDEIVEKVKDKYPDLSRDGIKSVLTENPEKSWEEINFARELADEEYVEWVEYYKEARAYGLMIRSERDEGVCNSCLDHDGTCYSIEEAERLIPLPHRECTNEECRCTYVPIPDEETFKQKKSEEPDLSDLYD